MNIKYGHVYKLHSLCYISLYKKERSPTTFDETRYVNIGKINCNDYLILLPSSKLVHENEYEHKCFFNNKIGYIYLVNDDSIVYLELII